MKKGAVVIVLLVFSMMVLAPAASADKGWPAKTIQVYIPFGAGGDTDLHCRTALELVAKDLGVNIVCTNMAGSAGTVAARYVKDSDNDGYRILFHQSSFLVSSLIGVADFDYNAFEIAGTIVEDNANMIMVNKKLGKYPNMDTFIHYGKDNPGKLLYGTTIGGYSHLQGLAVADSLGMKITPVDLGGGNETTVALMAGDCDFNISNTAFLSYVKSGDFQALALLSPKRQAFLPGVPTLKEYGTEFKLGKLFGFYFPKGTDSAIVKKFAAALKKAVNSEKFTKYCERQYVTPIFRGGQECLDYHNEQYAIMKKYKNLLVKK